MLEDSAKYRNWWFHHFSPINWAIWMPIKHHITATNTVECWHCHWLHRGWKKLWLCATKVWLFLTRRGRNVQIICDLPAAARLSVIWELATRGGMCQVQWEFKVKWVMLSPVACVFVCVFMCVCVRWVMETDRGVMCVCSQGGEHLGVFLKFPGE